MKVPKVSVVMSVYKEPVEWIRQSIDSVLNQTFSDFEFIIICDNPAYEEGIATLKEYAEKDNRIKIIFNEENIGLTKSLNKGLAIVKGDYIARMDADDISLPTRFQKQVEYLDDNHSCIVCGSNYEKFGDESGYKENPENNDEMFLFLKSPFAHPSVMFRRLFNEEIVKYNTDYPVSQDYALWTRLYGRGAIFYNVQEILLRYRCSKQQLSTSKNKIQSELSKKIRRTALKDYMNAKGMDYELKDKIRWADTRNLPKLLALPHEQDKIFRFYLLLSVDDSLFSKLFHILIDRQILKVGFKDVLRVLLYQYKGLDESKF